jgi:membrane protease YdiL (CAAX protease family)
MMRKFLFANVLSRWDGYANTVAVAIFAFYHTWQALLAAVVIVMVAGLIGVIFGGR